MIRMDKNANCKCKIHYNWLYDWCNTVNTLDSNSKIHYNWLYDWCNTVGNGIKVNGKRKDIILTGNDTINIGTYGLISENENENLIFYLEFLFNDRVDPIKNRVCRSFPSNSNSKIIIFTHNFLKEEAL